MTTLGALLLNPPLAGGARTMRHLGVAADLLGCERVEIANLFSVPTRDIAAINKVGESAAGWEGARLRLHEVITSADHFLAGWGVGGLAGQAARRQQAQLAYLHSCVREVGRDRCWTLNGQARHPSRWHQYVSDRHGRASGSSLRERLAVVLTLVPFAALCPPTASPAEVVPLRPGRHTPWV